MITWTASNNSTFLNGRRESASLLVAVRSAREYLRSELMGEGKITFYHDDLPCRIDEISIQTGYKWDVIVDPMYF